MEQEKTEPNNNADKVVSKRTRGIALGLMWFLAIIAIIFCIYFVKNVEFIKTNPCARCEQLGNICTAVWTNMSA